ncbi:MAG: TIGR02206 family membrane protein [Terracidiphilus sp.]
MQIPVQLFSLVHLAILAMVPLLAAALALLQRRFARADRAVRLGLAMSLVVCTSLFYGRFVLVGERMFPRHLPLELCDIALWLAIACLLSRSKALFDVGYYWCIAGPAMALLTPNLTENSVFLTVQFFADHGLIVVAMLYLLWTGQARPRPGSLLKAVLALNGLALAIGTFDWVFGTDYMFLMRKPPTASLLDLFGPWPWYILAGEAVGVVLFGLLYLPYRRAEASATRRKDRVRAA